MLNLIVMLLLAVVSGSASAEWVKVSEAENVTGYVDRATIRKTGNMSKMWELLDLKTEQTFSNRKQFMSAKLQREYDCKAERTRIIYYSQHSRNMGKGVIVNSDAGIGEWVPVAPDSGDEILWKIACGKR